jgi:phosphatidylglycerophosphatase A
VRAFAHVVATGAGSGYSPFASGTAGAAVGVLLYWPLAALSLPLYAVTALGAIGLAIWSADVMTRVWASEDDGRIVADEIAGQLVTLLPLIAFGNPHALGWVVTGFVLFRVYDVWKPGPVRWLEENLPGGAGVVMDDVLAGVFAAATLAAAMLAIG